MEKQTPIAAHSKEAQLLATMEPTVTETMTTGSELVPFHGGLLVPAAAVLLLLELENRGMDLRVVGDGRLHVTPAERLTPGDRDAIRLHRDWLKLLVAFCEARE